MPTGAEGLVEQTRALSLAHYAAFNAQDWDAIRAICAPDVVLSVEAPLQGHEALIAYMADLHRYFPGMRIEVRETATSTDHFVCENDYLAPPDAEWELAGRSCSVHVVRDGRIAEIRQYYMPAAGDRTAGSDVLTPGQTFKLAQEQDALRRVARLVARAGDPDDVFAAVAREIGQLVSADATSLLQFYDDDTMRLVSVWSRDDAVFPVGDRRPMNPPMLELRRTALPLRFETLPEGAPFLEEARAYGVKACIALPLLVEDAVWGVVFATSRSAAPFAPDTEDRAMRFTALAGIALARARARASLERSRARVLAAADASRRQVQRDLHDGAQQRLVHAIIELQMAREAASDHDCAAARAIDEALTQADRAKTELHDLVRGILPAALTRHGLRAGVDALAADLPVRVALHVDPVRLPPEVETTAYFVIAEALTNAVKHAGVDRVEVSVAVLDDAVLLEVSDEGAGGADAAAGTGLSGLADRVEASDGTLQVDSPAGRGTRVRARIPCRAREAAVAVAGRVPAPRG